MSRPQTWLGISTREWLIKSDTPHLQVLAGQPASGQLSGLDHPIAHQEADPMGQHEPS